MRCSRAFTIAEVLAVLGILAALAGLLYPVLANSRQAGLEAKSTEYLHQIQVATALYMADYGAEGVYGDAFSMGLPPAPQPDHLPILQRLRPPRAPHPATPMLGIYYWTCFNDPDADLMSPSWETYVQAEQENAVLYVDPFNNDPQVSLENGEHITRRFIAVTLGGSVLRKNGRGDWMIRSWWSHSH